jgi:uncharacterized membrane protein YbhN (UPF0104 family)
VEEALGVWRRVRAAGARHRTTIVVVGSIVTAGIIVALLYGRREEFGRAISDAPLSVLVAASLLQVVGLMARTESWHHAVRAAGATVPRRVLFRASAMQVLGSVINGQLGVAMRIAALRRSSPELTPRIPTLIAAEVPIVAVELMFAAVASFTLVAPLGIPWFTPIVAFLVVGLASFGLRRLSHRQGGSAWAGLTVLQHPRQAFLLTLALLVAILAQVFRNWMLLRAVGVSDATFWDAVAVLIAVATLAQLPTGPAAGAAAAVLILGSQGVAAAAAAGVLMTVTGTIGGAIFAAWSGGDQLWAFRRARRGDGDAAAP